MTAGPHAALFTGNVPRDVLAALGSFAFERVAASPTVQVLPAAPAGAIWYVLNGNVQGAAATSWSIREEVPSEPVRPMDLRTVAFSGAAAQPGGIATKGPLVFQNLGAATVWFTGTALLLPASTYQRYYLALTNAFQVVPISLLANTVQRTPYFGPITPAAFNNGDIAARTFELRFTRGAIVITNPNSSTAAGTRTSPIAYASLFPPLKVGDVVEARTTAAPVAGTCFLNGLLEASRELV